MGPNVFGFVYSKPQPFVRYPTMSPLMILPTRPMAWPIVIPSAPTSSRLQNGIRQRQAAIATASAPPNIAPKKAMPPCQTAMISAGWCQ